MASSSPFGTGDQSILRDSAGNFQRLAKDGTSTVLTYTYLWEKGTRAKETVTFSNSRPPSIHSQIVLTGKTKLTIKKTITPLHKEPPLPVSGKPPRLRVPKPLC